jgi:RNA polymerase sigma-70 factor (ECF subfamily)
MRLFTRRRAPPAAPLSPTSEAIFREELGFIVGTLLHFGIERVDVEDAAHEVIRAVLRSLPGFDPSRDLRSWLFGVAFNVASNHLRRAERHRARFVDDPADVAIPDLTTTIEDRMIQEDTHRIVREVLDGIPLDRRAVLIARVVHGMSELETAEALAIPQGTVKTRLRMAKQELRDGVQRREREENRAQAGAFLLPLGELLSHERRIPTVPAEMRARLWEQLQSLLAQPGVTANDGSPAPGAPPLSALRRLLDPEVGRILGGALVGGALVFALGPIGAAPTPMPTRETTAALASDASRAVPSTSATAGAAPSIASAPSLPRTGKTSAPAEVASAAELADPPASATLIKAATVAFEHHDTATARQALEEHARDFPRSKFGTTRELLWVRVLLSEGKRAEAQAKADALRKAAPQSPAVQALEALLPGAEAAP